MSRHRKKDDGEPQSEMASAPPQDRQLPVFKPASRASPGVPWYFSTKSATFSTVAAALLAVVALAVSLFVYIFPRSPERSSSLSITRLTLSANGIATQTKRIEGIEQDDSLQVPATTLTVLVENKGELPALIASVEAEVLRVSQFTPCADIGGEVETTGRYEVTIPSNIKPPSRLEAAAQFQVEPAAFDQLEFTVGPEALGDGQYPYVYELRVILVTSTGEEIPSQKVAISGPIIDPAAMVEISRQQSPACIAENRAVVDGISSDVEIIADELEQLRDTYGR